MKSETIERLKVIFAVAESAINYLRAQYGHHMGTTCRSWHIF